MACGGSSGFTPWRGRKAARLPPPSPRGEGADGLPYGVSSSTCPTSSRNEKKPDPPKMPISARVIVSACGLRIHQLQARDRLVEVADQLGGHDVLEDRGEGGHRVDRELGLAEVAILPRVLGEPEAAIAERRDRYQGLNEDVLDAKSAKLLSELLRDLLLVFRHGLARALPGRRSPPCFPRPRASRSAARRASQQARSDTTPRRAPPRRASSTGSALRCAPGPVGRGHSPDRSARRKGRSGSRATDFPR